MMLKDEKWTRSMVWCDVAIHTRSASKKKMVELSTLPTTNTNKQTTRSESKEQEH